MLALQTFDDLAEEFTSWADRIAPKRTFLYWSMSETTCALRFIKKISSTSFNVYDFYHKWICSLLPVQITNNSQENKTKSLVDVTTEVLAHIRQSENGRPPLFVPNRAFEHAVMIAVIFNATVDIDGVL